MIRIRLLSGPYAGQEREIPADANPADFIAAILQHGWDWQVDYFQATEEEKFLWFRQDLVARCVRALSKGRQVRLWARSIRELNPLSSLRTTS